MNATITEAGPVESARDCAEKVAAGAQAGFLTGEFPSEAVDLLGSAGLFGLRIEREYGGLGATTVEYVRALEHLAAADTTVALTLEVHVLSTEIHRLFGTAEQKRRWLPGLASGAKLGGVAITEPGAGSDLRSIVTTARRDGDHWMLDGTKTFITNTGTPISDGLLVTARTSEPDQRPEFGIFLVPAGTPGYRPGERIRTLGWRTMDTREVRFDGCRIPADHLIGAPGQGLRILGAGLGLGRVAFAAVATGLARACLDVAVAYARERVQFGKPIASFQAVQHKLADMATDIAAARALTEQCAAARDAGRPWETEASMAKLFAGRACVRAADEAVQVHGGRGFVLDNAVARYYADAKMMEIGEGTSEMQRTIIARSLGC